MRMIASTLTTDRLVLRHPQASDLRAYTAYCVSTRTRFTGGAFNAVQAFDKFSAMIGHWALRGFGRYVITRDGQPIGHVGPLQLDASEAPEMTWTLWDAAHEKQGFALEAAEAVRDHLLRDQGWDHLVIRIDPGNTASRRLAQKLGARFADDPAPQWLPGAVTYWLMAEVPA